MDPISRSIPSVLQEVIRKAPLTPEKVEFAWRMAVGPEVARATTVRLDEDGVLHVDSGEPHWTDEVRRARSLILARLAPLLGAGTVTRLATPPAPRDRRPRRVP
ncbi:MAG: DciA family protein [Vicinamibacterales bacterium]